MAETKQGKKAKTAARPGRPEKYAADQVLHTALHLYWTDGVTALSVNDVVRRMGIPKPSLYRHFPSEDALQASVLLAYEAGALASLNEVIRQQASFACQMTNWIDVLIDGIKAHKKGCLLFQMRENKDQLGAQAKAACDAVFARYREGIHTWLAQAAARGEVTLRADSLIATHLVLGLITLIRNGFRDGLEDAVVRNMAEVHMRGIVQISSTVAA